MFTNSFTHIDDKFISSLIEKFLDETSFAESKSQTFENLIDSMFKNLDLSIYINAFLESEKANVDDNKWMSATNSCISQTLYTTFSNVGGIYYKLVTTEFATANKISLINDFIKKYCLEKNIRKSLMSGLLSNRDLLTDTIGNLLGGALREEDRLREEEKSAASIAFEVYSKEIISYELPQLQDGKIYAFKNEAGEGVGNIIENRLEFRPPTVLEETSLYAEVLTLSADGVVEARNGFNIKVKPPKYLKPAYKTYRLRPTTTLKVGLEPVEENYKYYASVPKGFGSVSIEEYMLSYTAPTTALAQNVGVRLALIWNEQTVVYDTVVNFSIVVDGGEVDTSDSGNAFTELKEKVDSTSLELENIKTNSDSSTIIIDGNMFEKID